ncbi:MAG: malonate decarboxylase subunit epsilon, partial [Pseudomonas sp.]|nr:malonate decarboxylase subunit epsilon [Pseudomonas sp.]
MSSLFAFPGQGAQQSGMLHQLPGAPEVAACLREASAVLDEDVLALDSEKALRSTRAVQLCLLLAGVSCARLLM